MLLVESLLSEDRSGPVETQQLSTVSSLGQLASGRFKLGELENSMMLFWGGNDNVFFILYY